MLEQEEVIHLNKCLPNMVKEWHSMWLSYLKTAGGAAESRNSHLVLALEVNYNIF